MQKAVQTAHQSFGGSRVSVPPRGLHTPRGVRNLGSAGHHRRLRHAERRPSPRQLSVSSTSHTPGAGSQVACQQRTRTATPQGYRSPAGAGRTGLGSRWEEVKQGQANFRHSAGGRQGPGEPGGQGTCRRVGGRHGMRAVSDEAEGRGHAARVMQGLPFDGARGGAVPSRPERDGMVAGAPGGKEGL